MASEGGVDLDDGAVVPSSAGTSSSLGASSSTISVAALGAGLRRLLHEPPMGLSVAGQITCTTGGEAEQLLGAQDPTTGGALVDESRVGTWPEPRTWNASTTSSSPSTVATPRTSSVVIQPALKWRQTSKKRSNNKVLRQ